MYQCKRCEAKFQFPRYSGTVSYATVTGTPVIPSFMGSASVITVTQVSSPQLEIRTKPECPNCCQDLEKVPPEEIG